MSERFALEQPLLLPLAPRGHRFAAPRPMPQTEAPASPASSVPEIDVERRSLDYYSNGARAS